MQIISLSISPKDITLQDLFFIVDSALVNIKRLPIAGHKFTREGFLEAICGHAPEIGRGYLANLHDGNSFSIPLEIQSQNGINLSSSEYCVNVDLSSLPIDDVRKEEYLSAVQQDLSLYFGI